MSEEAVEHVDYELPAFVWEWLADVLGWRPFAILGVDDDSDIRLVTLRTVPRDVAVGLLTVVAEAAEAAAST